MNGSRLNGTRLRHRAVAPPPPPRPAPVFIGYRLVHERGYVTVNFVGEDGNDYPTMLYGRDEDEARREVERTPSYGHLPEVRA